MTDMSKFIAPKSDQLNADDLISGPRTITITRVSENASGAAADQPVNVYFEGDNGKPFRPCKSMRRVMVAVWGKDASQYVGRSMTIWRDPEVTWGGMKVGGIRISHMSHMEKPEILALTATQKQRKPYRVEPLKAAPEVPKVDAAKVLAEAEAAARKGTDAFRAFFNTPEAKACREQISARLDEFKRLATEADAPVADDDDPFGLPPTGDTTPAADLEQYESLASIIKDRLADADNPQDVLDMFDGELSGMKDTVPAIYADLMKEIDGKAAA